MSIQNQEVLAVIQTSAQVAAVERLKPCFASCQSMDQEIPSCGEENPGNILQGYGETVFLVSGEDTDQSAANLQTTWDGF